MSNLGNRRWWALGALTLAVLAVAISILIRRSRFGLGLRAIRSPPSPGIVSRPHTKSTDFVGICKDSN